MKKNLLLFLAAIAILAGCNDGGDEINQPLSLEPNFEIEVVGTGEDAAISITDMSKGVTAYEWSFPGGTPEESIVKSPQNIKYEGPGTYEVNLTVHFGSNETKMLSKSVTITP